jgi:hypothetical protein
VELSLFSQISKEIGFKPIAREIPTKEIVDELVQKSLEGDRDSFKELFTFYRAAPSPSNHDEIVAINTIYVGFFKARPIFEGMPS